MSITFARPTDYSKPELYFYQTYYRHQPDSTRYRGIHSALSLIASKIYIANQTAPCS